MDLETLNRKFALGSRLQFVAHPSGLTQAVIATENCTGSLFLLGAHVSEFQPHDADPVLFMSDSANYQEGKAIRGGIPICFPWFGPNKRDPHLPSHGTVRTELWEVKSTAKSGDSIKIELTREEGPFLLNYQVWFGKDLEFKLRISNESLIPQRCEIALHTYFDVADVAGVSIEGLEQLSYLDQLTEETHPATGQAIRFAAETDRIYPGIAEEITLNDAARNRKLHLKSTGSRSTVVWNPWIAKSQRMADFGDDEYLRMCCIETANIAENDMQLEPNETQVIGTKISVN